MQVRGIEKVEEQGLLILIYQDIVAKNTQWRV